MKRIYVVLIVVACMASAIFSSCNGKEEADQKPAAAGVISGADANTPPDLTVELSIAPIARADSYQWYKDDVAITGGGNGLVYTVSETGTYSVEGVNSFGSGKRSEGKTVTITIPLPDPAGTISGDDHNTFPAVTVELSIQPIQYATSYQWYKNNTAIPGADGLTYTVTETGVYSVEGVNSEGVGPRSPDKTVTITIIELPDVQILFSAEGGGIYKMNISDPSNMQKLSDYATSIQCMAYVNGTVYGITYDDSSGNNSLITVNADTGAVTVVVPSVSCDGTGLARNPVSGTVYASTWDGKFGTINLATGAFAAITSSISVPSFIAIDNGGVCYMQTLNGQGGSTFGTVNLTTGVLSSIATRDFSVNYIQGIYVDPATDKLYWIHRGIDLSPSFKEVDKSTGALTLFHDFGDLQASAFTVLP